MRPTKNCTKCQNPISLANIAKHELVCDGLGTWEQKQRMEKETRLPQIACCLVCRKEFKGSGLMGHHSRSHTNKEQQQINGKKGQIKLAEFGISNKGKAVHSLAEKERMSLRMIERLKNKPFWSKREIYNGITLDSSYEVVTAKSLDANGIIWERPSKGLPWFDGVQIRNYLPDFYLPEYDVYLDPKNDFLITKDLKKIQAASEMNSVKIHVLNKHNLTWDKIKKLL